MLSTLMMVCIVFAGLLTEGCDLFDALRADAYRQQLQQHTVREAFVQSKDNAKHIPVVTVADGTASITVPHPVTSRNVPGLVHYIEKMWAEDEGGNILAMWVSVGTHAANPSFSFAIPAGVQSVRPFAVCNKHGVYKGDVSQLDEEEAGGFEGVLCELSRPEYTHEDGAPCVPFNVIDADTIRKQLAEHNQKSAFQPTEKNTKHQPVLTLDGTTATVRVGLGSISGKKWDVHPMLPDGDMQKVHFIERIFVRDHKGEVVGAVSLLPTDEAVLQFEVPAGTLSLTAFSYCNKHGLFISKPTSVEEASCSPRPPLCRVHPSVKPSCSNPDL
eukprot:TRINITY_DN11965_c0_g1_i1.p1 TRINITY_DN11965_c0_g1~~TRINITY_DN11965_c0_g1_i1.p1  ORF type:complete len:346 (+),score=79.80 TRINITY_DN11965_c0_g1_i1:52-1038(+)